MIVSVDGSVDENLRYPNTNLRYSNIIQCVIKYF